MIIAEKGQMEPYILVADDRAVLVADCKVIGEVPNSDDYCSFLLTLCLTYVT